MEDHWWEVENMSMDDPSIISSTPPPPPIPLHHPRPLPHPQNMLNRYHHLIEQPNMINQELMTNIINIMNERNPTTTNNNLTFNNVEEDNHSPGTQGRPLGSKDKMMKSQILMNNAMQSAILEIIPNNDIMECLKTYSNQKQGALTVMTASGYVKDVTLRQLGPPDEVIIKLKGKHEILAMHGGFFPEESGGMESGLRVYFGDGHGHVIGGFVVGELVAYGPVTVVAAYFTSAVSQSLPQTTSVAASSSSTSAPPPPHPRDVSSVPPSYQGYEGVAPPRPPSSFSFEL